MKPTQLLLNLLDQYNVLTLTAFDMILNKQEIYDAINQYQETDILPYVNKLQNILNKIEIVLQHDKFPNVKTLAIFLKEKVEMKIYEDILLNAKSLNDILSIKLENLIRFLNHAPSMNIHSLAEQNAELGVYSFIRIIMESDNQEAKEKLNAMKVCGMPLLEWFQYRFSDNNSSPSGQNIQQFINASGLWLPQSSSQQRNESDANNNNNNLNNNNRHQQ